MSEHIRSVLKNKIDEISLSGGIDVETKRNVLKEEFQYYVLNFIYHHPKYSKWIMYGGSALRICFGLDRMSVDMDFEIQHAITEKFLKELKKDLEEHFIDTYRADKEFLTIKITTGRGLLLKFHLEKELSIGHISKQVHVKIDLNHFVAPGVVTERRPINHNQLSFVIITYNMSALMASKIAAIFLRGTRGVGKELYEEKGRDIYDLLWYMEKKIIPNFDYLIEKGIDIKEPRTLFDKLTLQMNKVSDANLKQDLMPLFLNQTYIENWIKNWLESYLHLLEDYKINTVTTLESIKIHRDFNTDNFFFIYTYKTEEEKSVRVVYTISYNWIEYVQGNLPIKIDEEIIQFVETSLKEQLSSKLKQYIILFYSKTEAYFEKTNRVFLGDIITTRAIRMTADHLNRKEEILLNKSALLSCELDDLLK